MDYEDAVALGYVGALQVTVTPDGEWTQTLHPLGETNVEDILEWATSRFDRLAEHGPEPDGWGIHIEPDGSLLYQLLARTVSLPDF
ncbi:hypothetical protein [Kribbella deserti]|uniref:Uncharacterized protein n=1 Tax=Kribbella deserti TaxID=1926257 RepID=A0ABV6QGV1_9ACTN